LTNLDVSNCTALTTLYCNSNQLTDLDVSKCTALTTLYCGYNQLTDLDVSKCTALTDLSCSSNQLINLDMSNCTALTNLDCYWNQLTDLDVSNCTALTYLSCYRNQLTGLDVSKCTALTTLYCYRNQLGGEKMDNFINTLPNNEGNVYLYDSTNEMEGNVCTKEQIAAIYEKGWTPYYLAYEDMGDGWYTSNWIAYENDNNPNGINSVEVGNGSEIGANAPAYDLNGNRVEDWQNRKGIYIIGGKKVVVK
ncbi:MAG: leucine-rich repeat domain-containing protein, partial [Prevotellaceae bacterium]|nr:leucine-rich repeat domain-containing protein [Prevotellaceae bacterium]